MQIPLDAATIVFAVIAIFVVWKLRSVLGTRVEIERKPDNQNSWRSTLPGANPDARPGPLPGGAPPPGPAQPAAVPGVDGDTQRALQEIAQMDRSFDPAGFVAGARTAYGMIVDAFSKGDRKTLSNLLADDALRTFMASLDERQKAPPATTSHVEAVEAADILRATLGGSMAHITLRFKARILEAAAETSQTVEANDIWTFARDVRSGDPNWKLIATATEDGHAG
jgi:predicted lipid-binding transport protein (Tim44 family)